MKIKLFPFMGIDNIEATVKGDVITLNGEAVDLGPLPNGFRLLGADTGNKFFVPTEYIQRIDGELHFTLFLNVEAGTDEQWRDPVEPIILNVISGKVPFPDTKPPVGDVPEFTPPPLPDLEEPPIVDIPEDIEND